MVSPLLAALEVRSRSLQQQGGLSAAEYAGQDKFNRSTLSRSVTNAVQSANAADLYQQAQDMEDVAGPRHSTLLAAAGRQSDIANLYAPPVSSTKDINTVDDLTDFASYGLGQAVSSAPSMVGATAGAIGAMALRQPGLAGIAAGAGSALPSYAMGRNYQTMGQYQDPTLAATPLDERRAASVGVGLSTAALDAALPAFFGNTVARGATGGLAGMTLKAGAIEGVTEGAQNIGEQYGNMYLDPTRISLDQQQIIDNAALGAFAGGGMAGAVAAPAAVSQGIQAGREWVDNRTAAQPDATSEVPSILTSAKNIAAEAQRRGSEMIDGVWKDKAPAIAGEVQKSAANVADNYTSNKNEGLGTALGKEISRLADQYVQGAVPDYVRATDGLPDDHPDTIAAFQKWDNSAVEDARKVATSIGLSEDQINQYTANGDTAREFLRSSANQLRGAKLADRLANISDTMSKFSEGMALRREKKAAASVKGATGVSEAIELPGDVRRQATAWVADTLMQADPEGVRGQEAARILAEAPRTIENVLSFLFRTTSGAAKIDGASVLKINEFLDLFPDREAAVKELGSMLNDPRISDQLTHLASFRTATQDITTAQREQAPSMLGQLLPDPFDQRDAAELIDRVNFTSDAEARKQLDSMVGGPDAAAVLLDYYHPKQSGPVAQAGRLELLGRLDPEDRSAFADTYRQAVDEGLATETGGGTPEQQTAARRAMAYLENLAQPRVDPQDSYDGMRVLGESVDPDGDNVNPDGEGVDLDGDSDNFANGMRTMNVESPQRFLSEHGGQRRGYGSTDTEALTARQQLFGTDADGNPRAQVVGMGDMLRDRYTSTYTQPGSEIVSSITDDASIADYGRKVREELSAARVRTRLDALKEDSITRRSARKAAEKPLPAPMRKALDAAKLDPAVAEALGSVYAASYNRLEQFNAKAQPSLEVLTAAAKALARDPAAQAEVEGYATIKEDAQRKKLMNFIRAEAPVIDPKLREALSELGARQHMLRALDATEEKAAGIDRKYQVSRRRAMEAAATQYDEFTTALGAGDNWVDALNTRKALTVDGRSEYIDDDTLLKFRPRDKISKEAEGAYKANNFQITLNGKKVTLNAEAVAGAMARGVGKQEYQTDGAKAMRQGLLDGIGALMARPDFDEADAPALLASLQKLPIMQAEPITSTSEEKAARINARRERLRWSPTQPNDRSPSPRAQKKAMRTIEADTRKQLLGDAAQDDEITAKVRAKLATPTRLLNEVRTWMAKAEDARGVLRSLGVAENEANAVKGVEKGLKGAQAEQQRVQARILDAIVRGQPPTLNPKSKTIADDIATYVATKIAFEQQLDTVLKRYRPSMIDMSLIDDTAESNSNDIVYSFEEQMGDSMRMEDEVKAIKGSRVRGEAIAMFTDILATPASKETSLVLKMYALEKIRTLTAKDNEATARNALTEADTGVASYSATKSSPHRAAHLDAMRMNSGLGAAIAAASAENPATLDAIVDAAEQAGMPAVAIVAVSADAMPEAHYKDGRWVVNANHPLLVNSPDRAADVAWAYSKLTPETATLDNVKSLVHAYRHYHLAVKEAFARVEQLEPSVRERTAVMNLPVAMQPEAVREAYRAMAKKLGLTRKDVSPDMTLLEINEAFLLADEGKAEALLARFDRAFNTVHGSSLRMAAGGEEVVESTPLPDAVPDFELTPPDGTKPKKLKASTSSAPITREDVPQLTQEEMDFLDRLDEEEANTITNLSIERMTDIMIGNEVKYTEEELSVFAALGISPTTTLSPDAQVANSQEKVLLNRIMQALKGVHPALYEAVENPLAVLREDVYADNKVTAEEADIVGGYAALASKVMQTQASLLVSNRDILDIKDMAEQIPEIDYRRILEALAVETMQKYAEPRTPQEEVVAPEPEPTPEPTPQPEASLQDVLDFVARMRGNQVHVEFAKMADEIMGGAAGTYSQETVQGVAADGMTPLDTVRRTIRLATDAGLNVMSLAAHESMHDFFVEMGRSDKGKRVRQQLMRGASNPFVMRQLRELLKDNAGALAAISKSGEERLAYTFQFYSQGLLRMQPEHTGYFNRFVDFLRSVFGIVTETAKAHHVMQALYTGRLADSGTMQTVLDTLPAKTIGDRYRAVVGQDFADRTVAFFGSASDTLRVYGLEYLDDLAERFYSENFVANQRKLGYVQEREKARAVYLTKLQDLVDDTTAVERVEAMKNLQSQRQAVSPLEVGLRSLFDELFKYMNDKGVRVITGVEDGQPVYEDVGHIANYFPVTWNARAIRNGRARFEEMLRKHGGMSVPEAEALASALLHNDGHVGLENNENHIGFTPFHENVNKRKLRFINDTNAADFAEFMSDDLVEVVTTYIERAVARAEYAERFGNNGEYITETLKQAAQDLSAADFKRVHHAVQAMQGTLNYDMSPNLRMLMSAAVTAQNIILLPLALITNLADAVHIAARSGRWSDIPKSFFGAMGGMIAEIAGSDPDAIERFAATAGITSQFAMLDAMGQSFTSNHMSHQMKRINNKFFKWNGMELWNKRMRIAALRTGVDMLERAYAAKNHEFFDQIGLDPRMVMFNRAGELIFTREEMEANGATPEQATDRLAALENGLFRYVDQSVLRPTSAIRPAWASDPMYMLFSHLKSFTFAMQNVMIRQALTRHAAGDNRHLFILTSLIPFMIATGAFKSLITGAPSPIDGSVGDMMAYGIERSGLLGVGEFALGAAGDLGAGDLPGSSLLGPTVDHALTLGQFAFGDGISAETAVERSLPLSSMWKNWN